MAIARPVDRRLFFIFDRTHAQLSKRADQILAKSAKVKTAQAAALVYLGYHDGCTLSELAVGVGHNNSAITGLVDRMSAAGLVERKKVISDGRAKLVRLTAKGWTLRDQVMHDFRSFNERLTKGFTETEIDIVYRFLMTASDNVGETT